MKPRLLIRGTKATKVTLRKLERRYEDAADQFYSEEAHAAMAESQLEVPVKYGILKNSKFIERKKTTRGLRYLLGYRASYAEAVHNLNKAYSREIQANAKWRYLADPIARRGRTFHSRGARRIRQLVGS